MWWILRGMIYGLPPAGAQPQSRAARHECGAPPRTSPKALGHAVAPRHHPPALRRRTRPVHAIAILMSSPSAASHLPRGEGEGEGGEGGHRDSTLRPVPESASQKIRNVPTIPSGFNSNVKFRSLPVNLIARACLGRCSGGVPRYRLNTCRVAADARDVLLRQSACGGMTRC